MKHCITCGHALPDHTTVRCIPCRVKAAFVGYHYNGKQFVRDQAKRKGSK